MNELLTTHQLQELIHVDRSTIYRMAEDGRLPAVKVGRQWRFPAEAIAKRFGVAPTGATSGAPAAANVGGRASSGHTLAELVDRDALRSVAELAGETLGTMAVVTDLAGVPLTEVANPCGLYASIATSPSALACCVAGWASLGNDPDLDPRLRPSELGFLCARTFVRLGDRLIGMVIVGGVRPMPWPPSDARLQAIAGELGVPVSLLHSHVDEVFDLDATERQLIPTRLPRFGELISRLAASSPHASPLAPTPRSTP
jgi:excisionase family DNA binding protein